MSYTQLIYWVPSIKELYFINVFGLRIVRMDTSLPFYRRGVEIPSLRYRIRKLPILLQQSTSEMTAKSPAQKLTNAACWASRSSFLTLARPRQLSPCAHLQSKIKEKTHHSSSEISQYESTKHLSIFSSFGIQRVAEEFENLRREMKSCHSFVQYPHGCPSGQKCLPLSHSSWAHNHNTVKLDVQHTIQNSCTDT